jgi:predicted homoserine dehydrogenase-like protein
VEVISSLHRDGTQVENDLRWGVYVVFEAPNDYTARCFQEYGVVTDASGRISALYRPFHLIGLELNISILSAALRGEATGAPTGFRGDVVATAKRDLRAGEMLDGEAAPRTHQPRDRRAANRTGEPGETTARFTQRTVRYLG